MAFVNIDTAHGLSYVSIGDIDQGTPIILVPGIMGNKKNLRGLANGLLEHGFADSAIIFDLRNHGDSTKRWAPFTVEACALDLVSAFSCLRIKPKAIIGHSFGGKVALLAAKYTSSCEGVWLLDCPPGPVLHTKPLGDRESKSALTIIELLIETPWPMESRRAFMEYFSSLGVERSIVTWMTTNLTGNEKRLVLNFEPRDVRAMLLDFMQLDLWPDLFSMGAKMKVHLVAAEYGQRFVKLDEERLAKAKDQHLYFHVLRDSGHFVHVDNLLGLIEIFSMHSSRE